MALKCLMRMDRLTTYLISSPSSVTITSSNACDILLCTIYGYSHTSFSMEKLIKYPNNNPFNSLAISLFICATLFTIQFLSFTDFIPLYFDVIILKLKKTRTAVHGHNTLRGFPNNFWESKPLAGNKTAEAYTLRTYISDRR